MIAGYRCLLLPLSRWKQIINILICLSLLLFFTILYLCIFNLDWNHFHLSLRLMKLFGYLFSFYMLLLTCTPCADKYEECLKSNQAIISQTGNHNANKEHNETCSPFCICACCGHQAPFNIFSVSIKYTKAFKVEKQFPISNQRIVSCYYGNIWQPPKLS